MDSSLRWYDPDRFNGCDLSLRIADTPAPPCRQTAGKLSNGGVLPRSILLRRFDIRDAISGIQDVAAGVTFGGAWVLIDWLIRGWGFDVLRLGLGIAGNQASKFFTTEKHGGTENHGDA